GTVFHRWVEQRSGVTALEESVDGLGLDLGLDDEVGGDAVERERLAELQRTFEASPWATRRPLDVERELHVPL
ncbi:hypothetical protein, partial [Salmonella enterica]